MCAEAISRENISAVLQWRGLHRRKTRASITSDAMEAFICHLFDGGFANAKEFITRFVLNDLENKKTLFTIAKLSFRDRSKRL